MGKAAKTKRAIERRKQKRAKKDAMRSLYEKWSREGKNNKSKRSRLNSKRENSRSPFKGMHIFGYCGNTGCKKCHPELRGRLP
jgi:hypothetical protein